MYNATNAATWLRSPPRIALRLNSTQRFVCYYATNSAPHRPSLHRVDALRTLSLRSTAQLNDLFVITLRFAARRSAPRLVSIQLNDLFVNLLSLRSDTLCNAALHGSTQRFVCYSASCRFAPHFGSTPLYATQRFVCQFITARRPALQRVSSRLCSIQRNDLFITSLFASLLNSTICLLQRPRNASHGSSTWLLAKQRNDLFVNLLSRLDTALGNEPRRNSPCRDAQQLNATN